MVQNIFLASMKLGILTCSLQPDLYITDQPLIPFFASKGIDAEVVIWNDAAVNWDSYDALLIRSIWDYYLDEPGFKAWLDLIQFKSIPMLNPIETVIRNQHKFYLRDLEKQGIDIVPTMFVDKTENLTIAKLVDPEWDAMVIKPAFSAGSHLTRLFSTETIAETVEEFRPIAKERDLMIQAFMPEIQEVGEISLIFFQDIFQYAVLKKPKAGDFRVQQQFGGQYEVYIPDAKTIETAQKIIFTFGGNLLYARVDGIISNSKFLLMELELIEPDLYFNIYPNALQAFGEQVVQRLEASS